MSLISEYLEKISNKGPSSEADVNLPPMLFDSNQEGSKSNKLIKIIGIIVIAFILLYATAVFFFDFSLFQKDIDTTAPRAEKLISEQGPVKKPFITKTIPAQTEIQKSEIKEINKADKSTTKPVQNPRIIDKADQLTINVGNVGSFTNDETLDQEVQNKEEELKKDKNLKGFKKKQNTTGHRLFFNMGLNAQKNNDYAKAENYYKKSLDIKPDYRKSLINLSTIYINMGNFNKAINLLDKLYEMDPDNIKTCVNLGIVYLEQKDYKKAEAYFSKAVGKDEKNLVSLYNMAVLYQKTGQYEKALAFYNRVIKIDPDNLKSLLALSSIYEQKLEYRKAVNIYEKCLTIDKVTSSEKLSQKIKKRIRVIRASWEK